MAKKSRIIPVRIRMPRDMHERIKREADRKAQTLNAEILARLERSFQEADLGAIESMKAALARIEIHLGRLPAQARARLEALEPDLDYYQETVDELRSRRDELERQRDEIESKLFELQEKQRRGES